MTTERCKYLLHVNPFMGPAKEREASGAEMEEILNSNLLPFDTLTYVLKGDEIGAPSDISSPGFVIELPYELSHNKEDSLAETCEGLEVALYKLPPEGGSIYIGSNSRHTSDKSIELASEDTTQSHFVNRYGNKFVWSSDDS